ncbi:MAG: hypothetical protein CML13_15925 [Puniceicoccaceae bacterium]|nr:hypothetical protein [Puniceicoccaceae bacterium]|tara:strand:- start:327 stop:1472 length:1146 start_codon:yes stop_codon:yes gene_type:complete
MTDTNTPSDDQPILVKSSGGSARVSWKISLDTLRKNIANLRPESKQAIVDAFLYCTKENITRDDFCKQLDKNGPSANLIYKITHGSYNHPQTGERMDISDKHLKSIQGWVRQKRAHAAKTHSEFVVTATAKKINTAYEFARESRTPVFLFGPSHIGKTWALENISETNNHGRSPYFRMRAAGGILGLLKLLASGLGVSPNSNREQLKERIFNSLDPSMVLILDEMHELLFTYQKNSFFACIEFIREIHDIVGCGMVLSFTDWGRDKIYKDKHAELNQFFRRGVHRFQLGNPLKADLEPILNYHGLDFPSKSLRVEVGGIGETPYEMLRQLSREDGLKSITERIRYSKRLATKAHRETPNWEDLVRAHILIKKNAIAANDWN